MPQENWQATLLFYSFLIFQCNYLAAFSFSSIYEVAYRNKQQRRMYLKIALVCMQLHSESIANAAFITCETLLMAT